MMAKIHSDQLEPSDDQIHVLLAKMDSNGNGFIEFYEMVDAILPDLNEEVFLNSEQLMEIFRSFDRNGNGYITKAELAEIDMNGDGVISFNEFASILGKSAGDVGN
ncbi:probable calcium-binding CML15 [Olea europaea subsp. europaea]|uniref:Probable calcium-binding CML15 n=1 Tax=Olea europaea subsp. europaea TaxID=158383 RepID=A0A8S0QK69_OLEEU|nr:probable calcium-binding CML15 [Olea europaea subsp. europaea]